MRYHCKRRNQFIAGCFVLFCGLYCVASVMVVAAPVVLIGYKIIKG